MFLSLYCFQWFKDTKMKANHNKSFDASVIQKLNSFNKNHLFCRLSTSLTSRSDCFWYLLPSGPSLSIPHRIRSAFTVIGWQPERTLFQTFYIERHAFVLSMKKLHGRSAPVYKDKNITEPDIIFHPVMNHSAKELISLRISVLSGHRKLHRNHSGRTWSHNLWMSPNSSSGFPWLSGWILIPDGNSIVMSAVGPDGWLLLWCWFWGMNVLSRTLFRLLV